MRKHTTNLNMIVNKSRTKNQKNSKNKFQEYYRTVHWLELHLFSITCVTLSKGKIASLTDR